MVGVTREFFLFFIFLKHWAFVISFIYMRLQSCSGILHSTTGEMLTGFCFYKIIHSWGLHDSPNIGIYPYMLAYLYSMFVNIKAKSVFDFQTQCCFAFCLWFMGGIDIILIVNQLEYCITNPRADVGLLTHIYQNHKLMQ